MTLCFYACRLDFQTFLCQNHKEKGDDTVKIARTTIRMSKDALKQLKSIAALEETTLSALLSALAEKFVEIGFKDSVRNRDAIMPEMDNIEKDFEDQWYFALENEIDIAVSKASSGTLQFLLNILPLGLALYIVEECIRKFFTQQYLSSNFFLHAIITLILVSILCFVFLQFYIKYFSAGKILVAAFNSFKNNYNSSESTDFSPPILFEIETIHLIKCYLANNNI